MVENIKTMALIKAVILLGLFGSLFIPLQPLMKSGDSFFSLATALTLIYAFYVFEKAGDVKSQTFMQNKPSDKDESTLKQLNKLHIRTLL